jgi:hypothetical protein
VLDKFEDGPKDFNFRRWMKIEVWGAVAMIVVPVVLFYGLPISDPDLLYKVGATLCFLAGVIIVVFGGSLLKKK